MILSQSVWGGMGQVFVNVVSRSFVFNIFFDAVDLSVPDEIFFPAEEQLSCFLLQFLDLIELLAFQLSIEFLHHCCQYIITHNIWEHTSESKKHMIKLTSAYIFPQFFSEQPSNSV